MRKLNCWEVLKCGRGIGGDNVDTLGMCPAATCKKADGINGGFNGGRCCWAVAGTFAKGKAQGVYVEIVKTCLNCDFYALVRSEEGNNFAGTREIKEKIEDEPKK
jgi:hypothetical protein